MRRSYRQTIPRPVKEDVLSSGKCHYCGCHSLGVIDHVHPAVRGGTSERENLVRACWPCNTEKSDSTVDEWRDRREALGKPWPPPNGDSFAPGWATLSTPEETAVLLPAIEGRYEPLADFFAGARRRFYNGMNRPFEDDMAEALELARGFVPAEGVDG